MSLMLDIVCIIIIWVLAAKGYKKGLVKGLFGVLSFVLSGMVTAIIYQPVSDYIQSVPFVKEKAAALNENIALLLGNSQQSATSGMPQWLSDIATDAANNANAAIADSLTSIIVSVFCIVVIYLLVKLAIRVFEGVFEILMKLPVLNLVNHAGGMVCGIITSVVFLWIVLACVVLFAGTEVFAPVNEAIQETELLKYFYNNNLLIKFIIR